MKSNFDILISFRTPAGFKVCGQYFLGDDPIFARAVFDGLIGLDDSTDQAVLHIDLVETVDDMPVRVRSIGCTLTELSTNCQHITRELFRVNAIATN